MTDLVLYGWKNTPVPQGLLPARVVSVHRERFGLRTETGEIYGRLKASVYLTRGSREAYPTVGDWLWIRPNPTGDALIERTLPRKSYFSRQAADLGRGEQAVAANFDVVFLVSSLNQDFKQRRLERYLSVARQSGAQPVVLLTKSDLVSDVAPYVAQAKEIAKDVPVYTCSAVTGEGLDALAPYLQPGMTCVALGSSGIGKSSLLNALMGETVMAVNAIREDDAKGRHTTTHRQMFSLPSGALYIDTPGMRTLAVWDAEEGITRAFADIEALASQCRFSDCSHNAEPGCAVRAALENGELEPKRFRNYKDLLREAERTKAFDAATQKRRNRRSFI